MTGQSPRAARDGRSSGRSRIATRRLRLEPLGPDDAEAMAGVLSDSGLYRFIGGTPPSPSELKVLYARWAAGPTRAGEAWHNWVLRLADGTAVGHAQATVTGGGAAADIAWIVGAQWQGRGYATEAARAVVEWLVGNGIRDVTAHIHPDNVRSVAVAERAGLRRTTEIEDGEVVWRLRGAGSDSTPAG